MIKDYELRHDSIHCHVFFCDSYTEALSKISKWWDSVKDSEGVPTIEVVTFRVDEDVAVTADVYWSSVPSGIDIADGIEEAIKEERKNPFSLERL